MEAKQRQETTRTERESSHMEELIQVLIDNNQHRDVEMIDLIQKFFMDIESQLKEVTQELREVKGQLHEQKDKAESLDFSELSQVITLLEAQKKELSDEINVHRKTWSEKAKTIVSDYRERGKNALVYVLEKLKADEVMDSIAVSFQKNLIAAGKVLHKIDCMEQNYLVAVHHLKNAGKALKGIEPEQEIPDNKSGIFNALRKPYQSLQDMYVKGVVKIQEISMGLRKQEIKRQQMQKTMPEKVR